jgi:GNAT superfamily N-acetyltransferase
MAVTYRQGGVGDSAAVFEIFFRSISDFGRRTGVTPISGATDKQVVEEVWAKRRSMFEHIARTSDAFWIAEHDGRPVGYARSIIRDGSQELTEFFVLPAEQSAGVGSELFRRAFPEQGARHRSIVATLDDRAQIRYLKAGMAGRFTIKYFSRKPEPVEIESDLAIEQMKPAMIEALGAIDRAIIGHERPEDHRWLAADRHGFVYRRAGGLVGYGYIGPDSGPFALIEPNDFPAVLAHAESHACGRWDRFGLEVPLVNQSAVGHLLSRGYVMDSFTAVFMSDREFGDFTRYIFFGPPFMI